MSATINRWTRRVYAIGESNKLNIHCPNTSKQRQPRAEQKTAWVMALGQGAWGFRAALLPPHDLQASDHGVLGLGGRRLVTPSIE